MARKGIIYSAIKPFRNNRMVLWLIITITLLLVNASVVLINSCRVDELNNRKEQILVMMKNVDDLQNSKDFLSHIIRGPICRLQGLFYLLERDKVTEKKLLLEKIEQVASEIDELTKSNSI